MRLKNIPNATNIISNSKYVVNNYLEYKKNFNKIFNNNNPINIEIGMGKGSFILNMAINNPNINFIGIEKYPSVLVSSIKKLEEYNLNNLKIICMDASEIDNVFDHEITTIYLNFSDPWPKNRHHKRRLTSIEFLNLYDNIFINKSHIIQKTDNINLFAYSVKSYNNYGYKIEDISLDYHNTHINIIKTEYEEKFSNLGYKINYIEVIK